MRETEVEKYLHRQVVKAGGTTRKFTGYIHAPDRIVVWPLRARVNRKITVVGADIHLAEVKAPGEKPRAGQEREHKRLRALGCTVLVLDTKEKVDDYVRQRT